MKVFFIIPPPVSYIDAYAYGAADKSNVPRIWLGLLYVAATLRKKLGIEPRIIDAHAEGLSLGDIEHIIGKEKPDLVGFSVLTFNLLDCIAVTERIKKVSPSTTVCYGGWHPTLYPVETMMLGYVDYVVIGEGEETFCELVSVLSKDCVPLESELLSINGIGFLDGNNEVEITPSRLVEKNLDTLPFPAYDLIDLKKYSNILAITSDSVAIMTSRGCPHGCSFCDIRKSRYRFRSSENVMGEIVYWYNAGVREFYIQDDNFTINRNRAIQLCRLIIDSGLDVKYKISSRVDHLDDELLDFLKKSGCYRINFGVESGSQKVLDYLQKGITLPQIEQAFILAKKYGIDTFAYVMIGCPDETDKDLEQTAQLIKRIKPDHLHCSICTPMPETYLYRKLLADNLIENDYWRDFAAAPTPEFKTSFFNQRFSDDELRAMQNKIQKKFYIQPRVVIKELMSIRDVGVVFKKARLAMKVLFDY